MKDGVGYLMDRDRVVSGYRAVLKHTEQALDELRFHVG